MRVSKDVIEFLKETASKIRTRRGNYYHIAYWYKIIDADMGLIEELSWDQLPPDLVEAIQRERKIMPKTLPDKDLIIQTVAHEFYVDVDVIYKKCKSNYNTFPRMTAMLLLRTILKFNYEKLGEEFYKDHSTAFNAVRKALYRIETIPEYGDMLVRIFNLFNLDLPDYLISFELNKKKHDNKNLPSGSSRK